MRAVSDAEMASYLPRVERQARRFAGLSGAEFDDLVQEGWEKVFLLRQEDEEVSNTAIKNAMRDWLRKCARWYQQRPMPLSDVAANDQGIDIPSGGRKASYGWDGDGTPIVAKPRMIDLA